MTKAPLPAPRTAVTRALFDPADATLIDIALVVCFVGPSSATGCDVVELHLHGGVAVIAAMLRVLEQLPGLIAARPGQFTRQAFDSGRLDLSQVEGLSDLIAAETEAQRVQALSHAGGRLRQAAEYWRSEILALLAQTEAHLDFADDIDEADEAGAAEISRRIERLSVEIAQTLADGERGERLRSGLTVALVGPPNVGKSSLLNALARRDVAIVAASPGTTRDVIEVRCDLGGVAVTIVDTAGRRDSTDQVELEGIRRGAARAEGADLVLVIGDSPASGGPGQLVVNKIDLFSCDPGLRQGVFFVSAKTGAGLQSLETWLAEWARDQVRPREPAVVSQARHRTALAACLAALSQSKRERDLLLLAEGLRHAARAVSQITHAIGSDDVLATIFAGFCIGK